MESESQKCAVRKREESGEKKAERRRSRDMQSCSIHHCVLLLLTLTFTTAPVADAVFPIQAKLHQRVTLPCKQDCSGEAKWTLDSNRDVVLARCDQTSCSSVVKGYNMSHDQYLKGDLSLTITSAEYSMRNTYVCECRTRDYSTVRLIIETVFSAVQKNPGEDLILDLTVPEPVEVIYTSSDSVGEQICNVTQHSLQCKAEYTHRTSLSYPELTLRDVMYSDSGRYTIRDTENKEDIRVYAVSVTGLTKGMIAGIVVLVLLVMVLIGVIIFKWREAEKKRRAAEEKRRAEEEDRKVENEKLEVGGKVRKLAVIINNQTEFEKKIEEAAMMIDRLQERYRENSKYSRSVTWFCNAKRTEMELWRSASETIRSHSLQDLGVSAEQLDVWQMMERVGNELRILSQFIFSKFIKDAYEFLVIRVQLRLDIIKSWCNKKRNPLDIFKEKHGDEESVKLMIDNMEALLRVYEKWYEEKQEELEKYKKQNPPTEIPENQSESEPLNRNV